MCKSSRVPQSPFLFIHWLFSAFGSGDEWVPVVTLYQRPDSGSGRDFPFDCWARSSDRSAIKEQSSRDQILIWAHLTNYKTTDHYHHIKTTKKKKKLWWNISFHAANKHRWRPAVVLEEKTNARCPVGNKNESSVHALTLSYWPESCKTLAVTTPIKRRDELWTVNHQNFQQGLPFYCGIFTKQASGLY